MNLTPLRNRAGQLPEDNWYHLVPVGEYPHMGDDKKKRVQVLDADAVTKMANAFKPKVLVDQDHFSYDPDKSSEAFGWLTEVQPRADGLWGKIDWTDLGDTAIKNSRYRFLSPVWLPRDLEQLGEDRVRPLRLDSIGLTNSPNLKGMVPLKNRDDAGASAAGQQQQHKTKSMKAIAEKLGLSAEASEGAIVEQITKLQNRAAGAEAQVSGLTKENGELKNRVSEQDNEQIESEFDARNVEESKRTKLRPVLSAMKNRTERVEFLNGVIGEPEDPDDEPKVETRSGKPVLNRATAGTPNPNKGVVKKDEETIAREMQSAVNDYALRNRCSFEHAFNAVRSEKPELFGLA